MQGPNLACNPEKLEYPGRTVTPEAEAEPDIETLLFTESSSHICFRKICRTEMYQMKLYILQQVLWTDLEQPGYPGHKWEHECPGHTSSTTDQPDQLQINWGISKSWDRRRCSLQTARSIVERVKEQEILMQGTLFFADSSSQTGCKYNKGAAIVAETPGAAQVVKETAGNVCRTISRVRGFKVKYLCTP